MEEVRGQFGGSGKLKRNYLSIYNYNEESVPGEAAALCVAWLGRCNASVTMEFV